MLLSLVRLLVVLQFFLRLQNPAALGALKLLLSHCLFRHSSYLLSGFFTPFRDTPQSCTAPAIALGNVPGITDRNGTHGYLPRGPGFESPLTSVRKAKTLDSECVSHSIWNCVAARCGSIRLPSKPGTDSAVEGLYAKTKTCFTRSASSPGESIIGQPVS